MSRFIGVGNIWNVIKEINVGEIREQAEQPLRMALIGAGPARHAVATALVEQPQRFAGSYMAIEEYELPLGPQQAPTLHRCDLALLVADGAQASDADIAAAADQIVVAGVPAVAVLAGNAAAQRASLRATPAIVAVIVPDLEPATVVGRVAPVLLDRLPDDQRLAAARVIPALRDTFAKRLINDTSTSNATYALTSGLPEMVPILNLPLNAADLVVLTKNQVLLVYKIALAYGAPSDFQAQMREVLPVIGGGFFWRQIARQLVGLIPGFGILPKVAVSYAGTYVTGQAAQRWYRNGDVLSQEALQGLFRQALTLGRRRAGELAQQNGSERPSLVRRLFKRK